MRRFFVGLAILAVAVQVPIRAGADDRQIAQQIVKQLRLEKEKGNLKGFGLDLKVEDGEVHLTGTVSTKEQEELAIEAARSVEGVTAVIEEIDVKTKEPKTLSAPKASYISEESSELVKPVSFDATDDSPKSSRAIAESIVSQLREEKNSGNLKGFGIDVEVDKGIVWLKGSVSTPKQEKLAIDIARHTQGVKKVVNALAVTSTQETAIGGGVEHAFRDFDQSANLVASAKTDSTTIAQSFIQQLQAKKKDGTLRDFGIDVQVDDESTLWLSGYVASERQQKLVLDIARYTEGVTKVINDLTISGEQSLLEPAQLATATSPIGESGQPANLGGQQATPYYGYLVPTQHLQAQAQAQAYARQNQTPLPFAQARPASHAMPASMQSMQGPQPSPVPMSGGGYGIAPARYDHPQMPGYAWPSYSAYPNYGAVTYPQQYSPSAWPYIGPFYPYPQVPLGWRKVALEWDDGWWHLKFNSKLTH